MLFFCNMIKYVWRYTNLLREPLIARNTFDPEGFDQIKTFRAIITQLLGEANGVLCVSVHLKRMYFNYREHFFRAHIN